MKILNILSTGYENGGVECGIIETKKYFAKKGHNIKVLSSNIKPELQHFSDFEFEYIKSDNKLKFLFHLFNPYAYLKLKQILIEYKPDIIHLRTMDLVSPSVLFLLRKYPTVMTIHGPEFFIKSTAHWHLMRNHFKNEVYNVNNLTFVGRLHYIYRVYIQRYIFKFGLRNVDLFIVYSNFMKDICKYEVQPIVKTNNYVNLLNYKPIQNTNNLLFIGRIKMEKGVNILINAIPLIIKHFPNIHLTIVGDGDYRNNMELLTKNLNLKKNITFIGNAKHDMVEKYYHNASIIILPSIWPEAFGKVGVEAMSAGRPVIASKVGGIPEWLDDEKTGYLVEPGNSQQIADKVILLLKNKKLLNKMGENARKKSELYSITNYIDEIEKIYIDITKKYLK